MPTQTPKPLPDRSDPDTGFFWERTERGELHVKQCADCTRHHWPPRLGCPYCGSAAVTWVKVKPQGRIYSWTVIHRSRTPGFEHSTPYAVVLVELTEAAGVRMVGNVVDLPLDRLAAGLAVEAAFTPSEDPTITLVCWRPASGMQCETA